MMNFATWLRAKLDNVNPGNNARVTPDLGETKNVLKTSFLDNAINTLEAIDGTIANAGAAANVTASRPGMAAASIMGAPLIPYAGRIVTGLASKFEPIQAGLWAIDAGRSVFDAEYRKRHLDALKMLEKGKKNSVLGGAGDGKNFNLTAALQTLEHPTATGGALIRYAQESAEDLKKAKQSDKGSTKEVANKKIKEQRELVDLIKYLSQNDSFLGGSNTNSERSITTAKAYFK
jgi:hypothetical protein